ncbi:hypothetical protein NECAME_16805 [Necator americanus]|uniref:Uncharacterized protein n=1 Tax=Necator americanus TaxID=51031 RepID=W2TWE9_NECAM|nr:hypothetical protein NECAME_16805 [Necator americanus]ETN85332.1 hypothetical protein NECAME_16805 [Necator americanus]
MKDDYLRFFECLTGGGVRQQPGRMTGALAFAVFSVTLGSFQFGYHIGCVNAPGEMITAWFQESHQSLFNQELPKASADLTW